MYMIHTCPDREWYVDRFLVPSLVRNGISRHNILIYNDYRKEGNLKACLNSFRAISLRDNSDTWHIQDDVVIASNFKRVTERFDRYITGEIMCGMCMGIDEDINKPIGTVSTKDLWYSFQCIRIPNNIAGEFVDWVNDEACNDPSLNILIRRNKYDDSLFKEFLISKYNNLGGVNIYPNLVDHIDYLLGGSIINPDFPEDRRAKYFLEKFLVSDLEQNLKLHNLSSKLKEQIGRLNHVNKRNTNFSRFDGHSHRFTEPDNYNGAE